LLASPNHHRFNATNNSSSALSTTAKVNSENDDFHVIENMKANNFAVGSYAEVTHAFTQTVVNTFAAISGDNNPLHNDLEFAKTTMFGHTIVHGILVSSLFSTLFGRSIHGAIYVSQSLQFKRPVLVGVSILARTEIINREEKKKGILITCATTVRLVSSENKELAVEGEAKVLVPYKIV
jgi:acyl dehydratase